MHFSYLLLLCTGVSSQMYCPTVQALHKIYVENCEEAENFGPSNKLFIKRVSGRH